VTGLADAIAVVRPGNTVWLGNFGAQLPPRLAAGLADPVA
jgi:hypothetical protein